MTSKKETASETTVKFDLDTQVTEEQVAEQSEGMELSLLKERADQMGLTYHPSIGAATLRAKIAAVLNAQESIPAPIQKEKVLPVEETKFEKASRLKKASNRLIRVIVNCMNPAKQSWEGEVFTVSNSVIGTVRKYVPFNIEAGWHIPYVIYEQLLERKCQIFYTIVDSRTRMKTRRGKLINEFNIVVLPALTHEELKDLATQQAVNNSID